IFFLNHNTAYANTAGLGGLVYWKIPMLGNYLNKRNVSLVIKQKIFAQSISFVIKIILPDTMKL
ncbi:hypothetical protein NMT78_10160, partial [Escherichia coli]|nr:hypothetical protein [Escherichia coli]